MISVLLLAVILFDSNTGPKGIAPSVTCVDAANTVTAIALEQYQRRNFNKAASLARTAAEDLRSCLKRHSAQSTNGARQRVGEITMYAGEYYLDEGAVRKSIVMLQEAKQIFLHLRRISSSHGTVIDELLIDSRQVEDDLRRAHLVLAPVEN